MWNSTYLLSFRKIKLESALSDPWWRVEKEELNQASMKMSSQSLSKLSLVSGKIMSEYVKKQ